MLAEWTISGKPTVLGAASGAVAGLVAITPASGFVAPISAIIIGLAAGVICFSAVRMKPRFGYDDALDVVGVHAVGGIFGALATGVFASAIVNPAGANGLLYGNPRQLLIQAVGVIATIAFSFVGSSILLKLTDVLVGIRVNEEDEQVGLDLSQHNESAYAVEA
jgi:Amt family ammonium transporter